MRKEKEERPCGTYLLGNVGLYFCLLKGFLKINPCGMDKGMKSERVPSRQPLSPLIPLCGIYLLRTSAIQARLIALGLSSVSYLQFVYFLVRFRKFTKTLCNCKTFGVFSSQILYLGLTTTLLLPFIAAFEKKEVYVQKSFSYNSKTKM